MRIRHVGARAALRGRSAIVTMGVASTGIVSTIRIVVAMGIVLSAVTGCAGGLRLFRQYEYEEDIYLAVDGTATVYVNSSIAALDALRGTSFDTSPIARVDTSSITAYFASPAMHVTRVATSRRNNRRFIHVRIDVDDVRRLSEDAAFRWSQYDLTRDDNQISYRQVVSASAAKDVGRVGWNGREMVAFRLHLPSRITYSNANVRTRGNILAWEQPLAARLRGEPLTLEARMETESILFRTLWLFLATLVAVAATFALGIWWVMRRGPKAVAV